MILTERHIIKQSNTFYNELDNLCFLSKNLYNSALYAVRQFYFTNKKYLNWIKINNQFVSEKQQDYYALPCKVSQQTLKMVDQNINFAVEKIKITNNINVNNIMEKKSFYVLNWDFNSDNLVHYDILPYFRECYKVLSKGKRPVTIDEWKEFVKRNGMYRYWSRCEYEIIITGWPKQKREVKVDIWKQIEMNIDVIVGILMDEFKKTKKN